ncbi:hypothetical protein [Burkholderia stagnalis]
MKRIHFYATKSDILTVTDSVESGWSFKYILVDHFLFPNYGSAIPMYGTARDIPDLGVAAKNQTGSCERYLVVEKSVEVRPMTKHLGKNMPDGGRLITYCDPGDCAEGVELNTGGFWSDGTLISGLIQTWSDDPAAQRLMRRFGSALKKHFSEKINAYWVGPEAYEFLRNGGRLTPNVSAPPEFDLKLPDLGEGA